MLVSRSRESIDSSKSRVPAGAIPASQYRRQQAKIREPKPDYAGMLATQCVGAGLPEPVREFKFAHPRKWSLDLAWQPNIHWGNKLWAVEIEGGAWVFGRHNWPSGFLKDIEKYNEATLRSWRLLRVTPEQVEDGTALRLVERALRGKA